VNGHLKIEFRDGSIQMREGDLFVVPKGVDHKPIAREECTVLLIEPEGTVNTGDSVGKYTTEDNQWI